MTTETTTNNNQDIDITGWKVNFRNETFTVCKRNNIKRKYFLFDTKKKVYLSSLFKVKGKTNVYHFDVRDTKEEFLIKFVNGSSRNYEIKPLGKKRGGKQI